MEPGPAGGQGGRRRHSRPAAQLYEFAGHGAGARTRALVTGAVQEELPISITVLRRPRARAGSPGRIVPPRRRRGTHAGL